MAARLETDLRSPTPTLFDIDPASEPETPTMAIRRPKPAAKEKPARPAGHKTPQSKASRDRRKQGPH